eukprot:TRINITY_DN14141_c0_g1_i1.p1 TRINITY_DN14141_c0_g1~~TRINITY_DN14141_c0_g1_i1.p1  ORF type:complete len:1074 (+),score=109.92 TRINITY_DN14141_c0_g1_i1:72-3293(+)
MATEEDAALAMRRLLPDGGVAHLYDMSKYWRASGHEAAHGDLEAFLARQGGFEFGGDGLVRRGFTGHDQHGDLESWKESLYRSSLHLSGAAVSARQEPPSNPLMAQPLPASPSPFGAVHALSQTPVPDPLPPSPHPAAPPAHGLRMSPALAGEALPPTPPELRATATTAPERPDAAYFSALAEGLRLHRHQVNPHGAAAAAPPLSYPLSEAAPFPLRPGGTVPAGPLPPPLPSVEALFAPPEVRTGALPSVPMNAVGVHGGAFTQRIAGQHVHRVPPHYTPLSTGRAQPLHLAPPLPVRPPSRSTATAYPLKAASTSVSLSPKPPGTVPIASAAAPAHTDAAHASLCPLTAAPTPAAAPRTASPRAGAAATKFRSPRPPQAPAAALPPAAARVPSPLPSSLTAPAPRVALAAKDVAPVPLDAGHGAAIEALRAKAPAAAAAELAQAERALPPTTVDLRDEIARAEARLASIRAGVLNDASADAALQAAPMTFPPGPTNLPAYLDALCSTRSFGDVARELEHWLGAYAPKTVPPATTPIAAHGPCLPFPDPAPPAAWGGPVVPDRAKGVPMNSHPPAAANILRQGLEVLEHHGLNEATAMHVTQRPGIPCIPVGEIPMAEAPVACPPVPADVLLHGLTDFAPVRCAAAAAAPVSAEPAQYRPAVDADPLPHSLAGALDGWVGSLLQAPPAPLPFGVLPVDEPGTAAARNHLPVHADVLLDGLVGLGQGGIAHAANASGPFATPSALVVEAPAQRLPDTDELLHGLPPLDLESCDAARTIAQLRQSCAGGEAERGVPPPPRYPSVGPTASTSVSCAAPHDARTGGPTLSGVSDSADQIFHGAAGENVVSGTVRCAQQLDIPLPDGYPSVPLASGMEVASSLAQSVMLPYTPHHEYSGALSYLRKTAGRRAVSGTGTVQLLKDIGVTAGASSERRGMVADDVLCLAPRLFSTEDESNSWVEIVLSCARVIPTHYTLAYTPPPHARAHPEHFHCEKPVSWRLEASVDGVAYDILSEHTGDDAFGPPNEPHDVVASFKIDDAQKYYCHFRVVQTAANGGGSHHLCVSGFEVYGLLKLL